MNEPEIEKEQQFVEGADYYFEDGLLVMTAEFLLKRGYCCGSGCRHCPYPQQETDHNKNSSSSL